MRLQALLVSPLFSLLPHLVPFRFHIQADQVHTSSSLVWSRTLTRNCPSTLPRQAHAQGGATRTHSVTGSVPDLICAALQAQEQLGTRLLWFSLESCSCPLLPSSASFLRLGPAGSYTRRLSWISSKTHSWTHINPKSPQIRQSMRAWRQGRRIRSFK